MADWEFNLEEYMNDVNKKNLLGLDAEEPSLVKESDYEYAFNQPSAYAPAPLVSSGYEARRNDLMEQQARAEANAMDLLKQSLNKSAEVTPTQGFAAALLAAIPTLGGYMIGKSVGEPELPPGYFEAGGTRAAAGLDKYQTGAAAGGLMGTQIGGKSAGIFLEGLDANQEQANKARVAMAELEKQKGARLESQLGSLENQAIAREDNQAFQRAMLEDRTAAAKEMAGYRDSLKGDDSTIPAEVLAKIERGEKLEVADLAGLDDQSLRSITALKEAVRREDMQNFKKKQSALPGYSNYSNAEMSPSTAAELSKKNMGISQTKQLIDAYLSNPDDFTGDASAVQGAISGLFTNAQRVATNSGANFTAMEKSLIDAASVASKAGNLTEWIKRQVLGRDQVVFAKTLKDLYEKTNDYAIAEAYGHFRNDKELGYYPEPILQKWELAPKGNSKLADIDAKIAEIEAQLSAGVQ